MHEREIAMADEACNLVYPEESYAIQGAFFQVYSIMGDGFLEVVYQECLELELSTRHIPFSAHPQLNISYCGNRLKQFYVPDFICFDKIIIELKAVKALAAEHMAQVRNYLKATGLKFGFLVNFCHFPGVEYKRIVA